MSDLTYRKNNGELVFLEHKDFLLSKEGCKVRIDYRHNKITEETIKEHPWAENLGDYTAFTYFLMAGKEEQEAARLAGIMKFLTKHIPVHYREFTEFTFAYVDDEAMAREIINSDKHAWFSQININFNSHQNGLGLFDKIAFYIKNGSIGIKDIQSIYGAMRSFDYSYKNCTIYMINGYLFLIKNK